MITFIIRYLDAAIGRAFVQIFRMSFRSPDCGLQYKFVNIVVGRFPVKIIVAVGAYVYPYMRPCTYSDLASVGCVIDLD